MQRRRGELRIIGGSWRSRRLRFADTVTRPTPDRVRQTTFDWLAPVIRGARVLDLCAGSGAMGLEALSRGAAQACLVERDRAAAGAIGAAVDRLQAGDRCRLVAADALAWLRSQGAIQPLPQTALWDIVFIDPPYDAGLWQPLLQAVAPLLSADHRVYLEWPGRQRPELAMAVTWLRQSRAGQVSFGLLQVSAGGGGPQRRPAGGSPHDMTAESQQ